MSKKKRAGEKSFAGSSALFWGRLLSLLPAWLPMVCPDGWLAVPIFAREKRPPLSLREIRIADISKRYTRGEEESQTLKLGDLIDKVIPTSLFGKTGVAPILALHPKESREREREGTRGKASILVGMG